MARVNPTVADIADKTKWEFYAGGTGSAAKWATGDVSQAKPLVEWDQTMGVVTMTYFAALKKYAYIPPSPRVRRRPLPALPLFGQHAGGRVCGAKVCALWGEVGRRATQTPRGLVCRDQGSASMRRVRAGDKCSEFGRPGPARFIHPFVRVLIGIDHCNGIGIDDGAGYCTVGMCSRYRRQRSTLR